MSNEQPSSKTLQDKWIAVAIWGALLAALVYTSANATVLAFGGSITSYLRSLASPAEFDNTSGVVVAIGGLAATIAVVIQLIKAWQKFGDLTHDLIAAYAKSNKSGAQMRSFLICWYFKSLRMNHEARKKEMDKRQNLTQMNPRAVR